MNSLPFSKPGTWHRGNLHTHSTNSDGTKSPREVCAAYRRRGYDFISLTDHFKEEYGFPINDTTPYRSDTSADPTVRKHQFGAMSAVLDAAYFEEINTFVDAVLGRTPWLESYSLSQESTATLAAAEKSWEARRWIEVDPDAEPKRFSVPGSLASLR